MDEVSEFHAILVVHRVKHCVVVSTFLSGLLLFCVIVQPPTSVACSHAVLSWEFVKVPSLLVS